MFIAIEGIDGCGKSTQVANLSATFQSHNIPYWATREPGGGGSLGLLARNALKEMEDIDKLSELFLVMAARKEHVDKEILPSLKKNKMVICDRFFHSSFAYYNYRSQNTNDIDMITNLHNLATNGLMPDFSFFLDLDPQIVLNSRLTSRTKVDKYDSMTLPEMYRLRDSFLNIVSQTPGSVVINCVDGETQLSPMEITDIILSHLKIRPTSPSEIK